MAGHDYHAERYFEQYTPTYSLGRYTEVVDFLRTDVAEEASLLDVGCASGNVLKFISENVPIRDLAGLDISPAYLEQCAAAVQGCTTHLGSVLEPDLRSVVGRQYRYVLVGAVLHHLVGSSRKESVALAREGLMNAWSLVDGGALILMEPTFRPHWLMSALFYIKRVVSRITSGRVSIFGHWNNLGEPVVSYLSHEELLAEAGAIPDGTVVLELNTRKALPLLWRLAGVTERSDSVLVIRKDVT